MKNRTIISRELWAELDEDSLMIGRHYEFIVDVINELISQTNSPILNRKYKLILALASEGYKNICQFNHELLQKFDY